MPCCPEDEDGKIGDVHDINHPLGGEFESCPRKKHWAARRVERLDVETQQVDDNGEEADDHRVEQNTTKFAAKFVETLTLIGAPRSLTAIRRSG
jgi:hypothetical protein